MHLELDYFLIYKSAFYTKSLKILLYKVALWVGYPRNISSPPAPEYRTFISLEAKLVTINFAIQTGIKSKLSNV